MIILGDIHDKNTEWLHYDWLEQHTATQTDVNNLNATFKKYNWRFKIGGLKHWGGGQCTGAVLKKLINDL